MDYLAGPNNHMYLYRREAEAYLMQERGGDVKMEAESDLKMLALNIVVTQTQAKECQQPPALEKAGNKLFPRGSSGKAALPTP